MNRLPVVYSEEDFMMSYDIPVTRSSMPPLQEYVSEIAPLWETRMLTNMGEKHQMFADELRAYLGVEHVNLFTNGHSALEAIFEAMELSGEVITTPFTFASTTHAIVRKGLTPVMCDIRPTDCTIDPEKIEALVTDRTCAIVPVHVYGNLCDVEAIQDIADRHGIKVIYDAAHAFGVKKNGVSAGAFGNASMFSFHATKVFNTIEGGAVTYNEHPKFEMRLNQWKNFGITGAETVEYVGGNAKMNEFCAAMGICNLRHVDGEIAKRKLVSERYEERLTDVPGLRLITRHTPGVTPNYAYEPVVFEDAFGATRDEVFDALAAQRIHARKYFYPCTNAYECYAGMLDPNETPIARDISHRVLALPMYADLALDDVDRICDTIIAATR